MPYLSSSENLLHGSYIIFQENVNNFELLHRICSILVWDMFPLIGKETGRKDKAINTTP